MFSGLSAREIVLPDGLEIIENGAFRGSDIEHVHIPASVEKMGDRSAEDSGNGVFRGSSLKTITFEEGSQLKAIEPYTFAEARFLQSLHIPDGVEEIGWRALYYTSAEFQELYIPETVTRVDSYIMQYSGTVLTEHESQPSGWHFNWNHWGNTVVWGYEKTIDDGEFRYAVSSLDTVTFLGISEQVEEEQIDLEIPAYIDDKPVVQIDKGAFRDDPRVLSVHVPKTVEKIWNLTFSNFVPNLEEVTFEEPSQLEIIRFQAFHGISATSIYIPSSVTTILGIAYTGADYLTIYTAHDEKPDDWHHSWKSADIPVYWGVEEYGEKDGVDYALTQDNEVIIRGQSRDCDAENLTIPDTIDGNPVTTIQEYAFKDNEQLTRIYIPDSVEEIGTQAFKGAKNVVIDAQAEEKPDAWYEDWNPLSRPVNWSETE